MTTTEAQGRDTQWWPNEVGGVEAKWWYLEEVSEGLEACVGLTVREAEAAVVEERRHCAGPGLAQHFGCLKLKLQGMKQ